MSDALEAWGDVWKRGYAIPDSVAEIMVDLRRSVDVDKTRNYLARLNGETVGIALTQESIPSRERYSRLSAPIFSAISSLECWLAISSSALGKSIP